ncbi:hypothetical protein EON67_05910 [archaeon]|nr:MAG: hypothetical protein EON67_05910 [archaeon]
MYPLRHPVHVRPSLLLQNPNVEAKAGAATKVGNMRYVRARLRAQACARVPHPRGRACPFSSPCCLLPAAARAAYNTAARSLPASLGSAA